jgi:FKBP-type peptidyl-prolyl cis-trans isomerase (trigger factor)
MSESAEIEEIDRDGATRVYKARVSSSRVTELVTAHLEGRAKTIRLPGFRPGKIPLAVMEQRYGTAARAEVANQLAAQAADRIFSTRGLASAVELASGATAGDLEFRITVTHLPDLPDIDFTKLSLERLTASAADLEAAGMTGSAAREIFEDHLRQQVLDYLDSAYAFTLAPPLIEREFRAVAAAAESQAEGELADIAAELRVIAERRVRLGAVVAELARRNGIASKKSELLEEQVIASIVSQAIVSERAVTIEELREMAT